MNVDSVALLKECDAGCKMAVESIGQLRTYAEENALKSVIDKYWKRHEDFGEKCRRLLLEAGEDTQDPPKMASAFAKFTTDVKMMVDKDASKIAGLLVDGCNMGIKATTENLHKYSQADEASVALAKEMIKMEQDMSEEFLGFL